MIKLYEVGCDWDIKNGKHIGDYENETKAKETWEALAKQRMPIYYTRTLLIDEKTKLYDYGSYTKFYVTIADNKE